MRGVQDWCYLLTLTGQGVKEDIKQPDCLLFYVDDGILYVKESWRNHIQTDVVTFSLTQTPSDMVVQVVQYNLLSQPLGTHPATQLLTQPPSYSPSHPATQLLTQPSK